MTLVGVELQMLCKAQVSTERPWGEVTMSVCVCDRGRVISGVVSAFLRNLHMKRHISPSASFLRNHMVSMQIVSALFLEVDS